MIALKPAAAAAPPVHDSANPNPLQSATLAHATAGVLGAMFMADASMEAWLAECAKALRAEIAGLQAALGGGDEVTVSAVFACRGADGALRMEASASYPQGDLDAVLSAVEEFAQSGDEREVRVFAGRELAGTPTAQDRAHPPRADLPAAVHAVIPLSLEGWTRPQLHVHAESPTRRHWPDDVVIALLSALGRALGQAFRAQVLGPVLRKQRVIRRLSPRQREIADMLAAGRTERQVAEELKRSTHTVHDHIKTIYAVLGVSNRLELLQVWRGERHLST